MRNPFYKPAPAATATDDKLAPVFERVRGYLEAAPAVEEIADSKLRRLHPELTDDDVWHEVLARLGGAAAKLVAKKRKR